MFGRMFASCAILGLSISGSIAAGLDDSTGYYPPLASAVSYGPAGVFGDAHLSALYFNGGSPDGGAFNLGGVVVVPFGNRWNAAYEVDAGYLYTADDLIVGTAGHLFYVNQSWAAGGFIEMTTDDLLAVGGEAAAFVDNIDAVASVKFAASSPDFWQVGNKVNFYVDPNTALSAGVEGAWFSGGDDAQLAFVSAEHRLVNSPFSGFVDLGWDNFSGASTYSAAAGARVVFGGAGPTLQDYNRANPF